MPVVRLRHQDELEEGMVVTLNHIKYGRDVYKVAMPGPYYREGRWYVDLIHDGCEIAVRHSLADIGITNDSPDVWVTAEIPYAC